MLISILVFLCIDTLLAAWVILLILDNDDITREW